MIHSQKLLIKTQDEIFLVNFFKGIFLGHSETMEENCLKRIRYVLLNHFFPHLSVVIKTNNKQKTSH